MSDDAELLRRYAEGRDEAAFAEVVERNVGLVYGTALRQLGGAVHRAQDVTQSVFIDLARQAGKVARRTEIAGWLYTSTHYAVAKLKRGEQRRQAREQEAQSMHELTKTENDLDWARVRPVLDEAMLALPERDREALLLRFFQGRRLGEVGQRLGVSEDAARMRVERGLEKLRVLLGRRGIVSTGAALAGALEAGAATAAPVGLAATVTGAVTVAAAGGATAGGLLAGAGWVVSGAAAAVGVAVVGAVIFAGGSTTRATERAEKRAVDGRAVAGVKAVREEEGPRVHFRLPTAAPGASLDDEAAWREAGQRALARDPNVRGLVDSIRQRGWEANWGGPLADMGLGWEERERIARAVLATAPVQFSLQEKGGWSVGLGELLVDENVLAALRAALGREKFEFYQDARRVEALRRLARGLAVALHASVTPLTAGQASALVATASRHARDAMQDGRIHFGAIDWTNVARELRGVLSEAQLAKLSLVRAALSHRQFGGDRPRGRAVLPPEWIGPQQAMELRWFKAELALRYAWFYEALGLSRATAETFEAVLLAHEERRQDIRDAEPNVRSIAPEHRVLRSTVTSDGRPVRVLADRAIMTLRAENDARREAEIDALLGPEGVTRWKAFDADEPKRDVVMRLVAAMALSEQPVSRAQAEKLAGLLAHVGFDPKPWASAAQWKQVLAAAGQFLRPLQVEELAAAEARARRAAAGSELTALLRTLPE